MPHGTNANDLGCCVKYVGMTPKEALLSATKLGGEIMMWPHALGRLQGGYLADVVMVDGNPLEEFSLLVDPRKIVLVIKDGAIVKDLCTQPAGSREALVDAAA